MTIDELHEVWGLDATIDPSNLSHEALRTPNLHSKYLRLLAETKLTHRKIESDLLRLKTKKSRYYRGEMGKEELAENQWQQYQGAKPLKTELENILEADEAVIRMRERLEYYRTFVVCIESIMKELNSRHFAIRASIDYQKMQNGVN